MNNGNLPTDDLIFFHGTGAKAACKIATSGADDRLFEEMGAFELGRAIRQAMLDHAGLPSEEDWRLKRMLPPIEEDEAENLWFFAMKHLVEPSGPSLFGYGHFAATLNPVTAYRYTIRNPYRSELIRALAGGLQILTRIGDPLPSKVQNLFPEVYIALTFPSPPVVLELHRIPRDRIVREDGGSNIDPLLQSFLRGPDTPASFRIRNVSPTDIAAVHDLRRWHPEELDDLQQLDPSRVNSDRFAVEDWFAQHWPELEAR